MRTQRCVRIFFVANAAGQAGSLAKAGVIAWAVYQLPQWLLIARLGPDEGMVPCPLTLTFAIGALPALRYNAPIADDSTLYSALSSFNIFYMSKNVK